MIEAGTERAQPLAYAAGHDRQPADLRSGSAGPSAAVSGLGTSGNAFELAAIVVLVRRTSTLFSRGNHGDRAFRRTGAVRLAVVECDVDKPEGFEVYSKTLEAPKTHTRALRQGGTRQTEGVRRRFVCKRVWRRERSRREDHRREKPACSVSSSACLLFLALSAASCCSGCGGGDDGTVASYSDRDGDNLRRPKRRRRRRPRRVLERRVRPRPRRRSPLPRPLRARRPRPRPPHHFYRDDPART